MSTRIYPLYQRGNPQLRVFLPNFWMRLVRPVDESNPGNVIKFHVSPEMSRLDAKSYLEKIYGLPVMDVHSFHPSQKIKVSRLKSDILYKKEGHEFKVIYAVLPKDFSFSFPKVTEPLDEKDVEDPRKPLENEQKKAKRLIHRRGVPSAFSL
uniref:Large ribosomal subunit protein uL23m n=1 Tax=Caligus rogercresseyi TaxID=217165 RepID=C1BNV5_CALRO|nr:Probable mitochondrial 39S ribosomal protein L23 [Caligus rogercresseyi]ACO11359.1 Probable mitochondrial 39S ribosomal protein L23 [Caligus rogercresseyi]|eukprot:TRINITY_DN25189_c0_g1_i1.p1 TRINITY_DN25189_c0_g1~~TRINITY_DN25189_c0_g1_i1.p1  ORF type:complete len:162 (+),score=54.12 TRINITY_DN25189_c0_g1_i1:33-488(+)